MNINTRLCYPTRFVSYHCYKNPSISTQISNFQDERKFILYCSEHPDHHKKQKLDDQLGRRFIPNQCCIRIATVSCQIPQSIVASQCFQALGQDSSNRSQAKSQAIKAHQQLWMCASSQMHKPGLKRRPWKNYHVSSSVWIFQLHELQRVLTPACI